MSNNKILSIQRLGFPWQTSDPFLFCAYHKDDYPAGNGEMGPQASLAARPLGQDFNPQFPWRMYHGKTVPGFPSHPHRGFETVTIAAEGLVDHADSLGAAGRFGNGDVQWMTAGKGVQHSEMFPLLKEDQGNPLELFQIWLNLPKKNKLVDPHFAMLWRDTIPVFEDVDEAGHKTSVTVIAGEINGVKAPSPAPNSWAADPTNQVGIWMIMMEAGATWTIPSASSDLNRTLYFYRGADFKLEETSIPENSAIKVDASQTLSLQNGTEPTHLLFLQGKPIGEAVAQHGPFVMNTDQEIYEAIQDFQRTAFGGWPWPKSDQVHPRERGRFAIHADGREEVK
ncbi:MAG: pirin family protein [Saprospiraceae bacterium]|nr:pirin family protein [Saprospiraceae bacterium]